VINPDEVQLLVQSIKQHSGTEVPTASALAALYELEHYRYRSLTSRLQQPRVLRPAQSPRSPTGVDAALPQPHSFEVVVTKNQTRQQIATSNRLKRVICERDAGN
jgi:hypothetical protein